MVSVRGSWYTLTDGTAGLGRDLLVAHRPTESWLGRSIERDEILPHRESAWEDRLLHLQLLSCPTP